MRLRTAVAATGATVSLVLSATVATAAQVDGAIVETDLVSEAESGGTTANGASTAPVSLSPDGGFVAFTSRATDLTADADTNGTQDVFLWDRTSGDVTLVSAALAGSSSANGASTVQAVSEGGAYVLFTSQATDLTAHTDANERSDVFLWERSSGEVTLVSEAASGGTTADDASWRGTLTPDGDWILFESYAADLTADTEPNHETDVFLWERATGAVTVVTRDANGVAAGGTAGGISDDGRYVAFTSIAEDFSAEDEGAVSDAFLWDRTTGDVTLISRSRSDRMRHPDARVVAEGISGDGSTVVLESSASDLTTASDEDLSYDVFAWDRVTDTLTLLSRSVDGDATAEGHATDPKVSDGGRVVAFQSAATDLTDASDTNEVVDFFAWSRDTGEVVLVSRQQDGSAAGSSDGQVSGQHAISGNGEFVAFMSASTRITSDTDDNDAWDVFRWERTTGDTVLVSSDQEGNAAGEPGGDGSDLLGMSSSGAEVLFLTQATDVTSHEDTNGAADLFLAEVIGDACPPGEVPDAGFTDTSGNVHADAIDCLAWWGITRGKTEQRYDPVGDVTRAQMASFLVRLVEATPIEAPQDPPDRFDDDEGSPHELAINQLAELGVVSGRDETTYDPHTSVTRAEMAAFLLRTYELITGETLSSSTDHFTDDDQSGHEDAINAVADAGFTTGVTESTYEPARPVSRAQMASFLTRLLDPLVTRGFAPLPG